MAETSSQYSVWEAQYDVRNPLLELALVDMPIQVVELQLPFGRSLPETPPKRLGEGEVEERLEVGVDNRKKTVGGVPDVVQRQLEGASSSNRLLHRGFEPEAALKRRRDIPPPPPECWWPATRWNSSRS